MDTHRHSLWLGAVVLLLAGTLQGEPLTLDACVRVALDKNPVGRAAAEGVAGAKNAVGEARAPFYPTLDFNAGYSHWQRHAFLPGAIFAISPNIPSTIGPLNDWSAGLRSRLTLLDFGERRARLRTAEAQQGAAEAELARIRQDIALNVHQAFHTYVAAQETKAVAEKNMARAENHVRLAKERKAAGAVPQADVLRAQVELANARLALVRTEGLVAVAGGRLNTAMGLPAELQIEVQPASEAVEPPEDIRIAQVMAEALQSREILKASQYRVTAAHSSVSGARSAFMPKVRAEGAFGWHDAKVLPRDKEWAYGISVDLPLFDGFARKSRLSRAKTELSREEADYEQRVLSVREEVWSAYSRLKEAHEAVRAAEVIVKDAQESTRLVRERYEVGAGTMNDLLDAETALARAEATQVEVQWQYRTAQSVFQRSIGRMPGNANP